MTTPEQPARAPSERRGTILVLCPYPPGTAASQRFRFEQYLPALREAGYTIEQASFWDEETWRILYKPGHRREKVLGLVRGFLRRFALLTRSGEYAQVFIHLEAAPVGPPVVEAALKLLGKKLVYDIDDAIFIPRTSKENRAAAWLRWRSKVAQVTRWSDRVIAVNPFLVDWARQHNPRAELVPTTIDPEYHRRSPDRAENPLPVVGWTGTKSTAPFLELVRPALVELQKTRRFVFRVICDVDPGFPELERYEFVKWREATEIADLQVLDVGLMPVPDDPFSRGKVGFKAIQYSALEIPPIVSDVGSGREVVVDGRTGLVLPNETRAWQDALATLLDDPERRRQMGRAARDYILERYSIPAQRPNYLGLFG
jgi:glycosyltransferase involved in cell wall biosynthesis